MIEGVGWKKMALHAFDIFIKNLIFGGLENEFNSNGSRTIQ